MSVPCSPAGHYRIAFGYNHLTVGMRWGAGVLVCVAAAGISSRLVHKHKAARVSIEPAEILANGDDVATLSIEGTFRRAPQVSLGKNALRASIVEITRHGEKWLARIRAGVLPGKLTIRIGDPGNALAAELQLRPDWRDRLSDGTPDFFRLDSEHDRESFRRWFTYLAEAQYFRRARERPSEINDCAALIRYAYREALHTHDSAWADSARLSTVPAFDSVEKYAYPFTPLGAGLFRAKSGSFEPPDASDGAFLQFADVRTLWRFNTHLVGRNLEYALPGDLLFYRQEGDVITFHSMIYLGASQFSADPNRYVIYHTGPERSRPNEASGTIAAGEMKRLTVGELLQYPQPEWRPVAANPNFLGVFRWNILVTRSEVLDARAD